MTEARLQSDCYKYFHNTYPEQRKKLFMVHNNPKNPIDGNRLKAQGMVAGVSDLMLLRDNRPPLCIEIKLPKGKQQPVQIEWQKIAESTGAEYVIIRSLDEFKALFDANS